ncbi:MAG TPA: NAD(P)-dependent oxidoreductase [Acidobacteriaceae bacterium]|jgi:nucleoside-diphosphate-sugar epimerase|nr:NAD(P)-dependent oxidoreductase [Acidobacteriaceae bacterium]
MDEQLTGKRVLVTGASGFIGAHLCRRLHQEGAEVHAVYRSQAPEDRGGFNWLQADVADWGQARRIVRETLPDIIYHLASHVKGAPDLEHVLPTFQSNLQSTVNLLTLAAETNRPRVVLTGSLAEPDVQNGELFPSAPYAAAKWASSGYGRMFHALYQVPVVIARVFMVYGPAQKDLTKLIPYVCLSLLEGKAPKISSGGRLVDWIYVSDVVDGFVRLGLASGIEGETLELGSGSLISIREIVEKVADIVQPGAKLDFGALPDRPLEPVRIATIAKTEKKIGWKPTVPLDEGLRRTVEWYRAELQRTAYAGAANS